MTPFTSFSLAFVSMLKLNDKMEEILEAKCRFILNGVVTAEENKLLIKMEK